VIPIPEFYELNILVYELHSGIILIRIHNNTQFPDRDE
jgi:hypothetical protein